MSERSQTAASRNGLLRVCFKVIQRVVGRTFRVLAIVMIAVSPNAPPPPLPRPPPIEARAEDGEGDDEEP
jgi:hypothetical protein